MHYFVSIFVSSMFFGGFACGGSSSQAELPSAVDTPASDEGAKGRSNQPLVPIASDSVSGPLPSHQPLQLKDRSDFSSWKLPAGDIVGKEHKHWSASISEQGEWNISYARVTELQQGQITIRGVENNGVQSEEYSHTAFLASAFQRSDYQAGTAVLFNRRYTHWGRILKIEGDKAYVQYLVKGKLQSEKLGLEGLLPIHTTLDKFGTSVVWSSEDDRQWFGGSAIYATKTGVYVISESHELFFLPRTDLHINVQHKHAVGDRVLAKSKNSQHWQPARVEKTIEEHVAYNVRDDNSQSYTVDWAHIIALPPTN